MNIYFRYALLSTLALSSLLTSCEDDDETTFVSLDITTQIDEVQVNALENIEIEIFSNDTNIPENGNFTISVPPSGAATIIDNGTPNDITDDRILYEPENGFLGDVVFEYTVCNDDSSVCKTETVSIAIAIQSPVNIDLAQFPYNSLSQYNFFDGDLVNLKPSFGVIPVAPITPLFTDYAKKSRFLWIPEGQKANYNGDYEALNFPVGSVLIKVFYYDNVLPNNTTRIIETRLMVKLADGWDFAEYVWNDDQTEALLEATGDGLFTEVEWIENGQQRFVNYRIPAKTQCIICHNNNKISVPLGIKPQSLNGNYTYTSGVKNQLQHLVDLGYLEDNVPANIVTVADWEDVTASLEDRARAYLDINCGNCHKDGGQGSYRPIRLAFEDSSLNRENLGICVQADTQIPGFTGDKLIEPGAAENSIISYRMQITDSQYTMPQFGRSLTHDEGVALINEWINSLSDICD